MRGVCVCVEGGWREALFIVLEVGSRQKNIWKVIKRRGILGVGRPHLAATRPQPLLVGWHVGLDIFPCLHFAWCAYLLCHMCSPCKCVTPDVIFCVVVWRLLRVFVLFCSCSSKKYKTRKQLWSKVSDTNMRVMHVVFLYYWVKLTVDFGT